LGVGIQLCYLRHLGRVLGTDEAPDAQLLDLVAAQLKVPAAVWDLYANRDQTRREHLQEILERLSLKQFDRVTHREIAKWLLATALQTTQGLVLAQAVVEELRRRCVVLPPVLVIERICSEVATRAQRHVHRALTESLTDEQRKKLDRLLESGDDGSHSLLAWLRLPPGAASARNILSHIERLLEIRSIGISVETGRKVHQNRLLRLAREGAQTAVFQLQQYEIERRHATLVAILVEATATLTDEILDLHDRMIGSFFTKAKNKHEKTFAAAGKAINEKLQLYAKVGSALIDAKEKGSDPFLAIAAVVPWEVFTTSVREAEQLASEEDFDCLGLIVEHYGQLRRYAPTFLETFEFRAASAAQEIIGGIEVLRNLNRTNTRNVPCMAPIGFVRKRWNPFVFNQNIIDRRFYELAVMTELKNGLRAGDISVVGSRQFKDFDDYLVPKADFDRQQSEDRLGLSIPSSARAYLDERLIKLRETLDLTEALGKAGELPDVELSENGMKILPLEGDRPDGSEALNGIANGMLPRLKITDLLLEVDRWTNFTRHFSHLKTNEPVKDRALLLTAILADAINLGLVKMAEACPGKSLAKLAWLVAWHIRDETYRTALAELVNFQHRIPFALHWGEGTTSSSDGQRYRAGGRGEAGAEINARYGIDPSVTFYTHISDQYAPFHTKVINATVRDATHVLDGLLYHESDLRIEEHYTDTSGFTDHVFALCHFLGFRFAPRIRDLADKRLYVPGKSGQWPALEPLIGGPLNLKLIEQQFLEILRLVASIKQGTVTASLILRKLGSYPRQNGLALALRELGRVERTLFTLEWLQNPALRRRVNAGLNKGEARNALARAFFFNRLGEIRDRSFENQRYRASGLNLVVAAIALWNTVYLERAILALRQQQPVDEALLKHLSPLGWEHINLTGDYVWHANKRVAAGRFRPLRFRRIQKAQS
jgi:TnpA family transposase